MGSASLTHPCYTCLIYIRIRGMEDMANFNRSQSGVLCIEAPWSAGNDENDETKPKSVLPGLELINTYYGYQKLLYRTCATRRELAYHFEDFKRLRPTSKNWYGMLYFASHGSKGSMHLPGEKQELDLEILAEMMGKIFSGFVVYFGSCSVMKCSDAELQRFSDLTGADMVVGYEADVDWIDSTILDILFLNAFSSEKRPKSKIVFWNGFRKRYGELIDKYKMVCFDDK